MIRLLTLGTADLHADGARPAARVLAQPKRFALLVYLALREPAGLHQRNTLLTVFWPESDESRARNALRNTLHHLRGSLGADAIVSRGDDALGVNPDEVWCDALEFERRIAAGDYGEALELYRGELLPGFLPAELDEFTDWLDTRRRGLERKAAEAARAVASGLAAGDAAAVAAAHRWVELAPYDESAARMLVQQLEHADRQAEARDVLAAWNARYAREMGAVPEDMRALEKALGERAGGTDARAAAPVRPPASRLVLAGSESGGGVASARVRARWPLRYVAAAAAAVVLLVTTAWAIGIGRGASSSDAGAGLAVLPFSYSGAEDYGYLREAMTDLLSTRLHGAGGLRAVDSRSVLVQADRNAGRTRAIDAQRGQRIAQSFDAEYFVLGSVVELNGKLHVSAALYKTAARGDALARTSLSGDVGQLFALADSISHVLFRATRTARRVDVLAANRGAGTRSLAALREYTAGEIAFNAAHYADAHAAFERATRADPSYARAWFRQSMAAHWVPPALVKAPLAEARRFADRLSTDERVLLDAWTAHIYADPLRADSLYTVYLAAHPENAEAWFQLGEVRTHWGSSLGVPAREAADALRRALNLVPDHAATLIHLLRLAGRAGDTMSVATLTDQLLALGPAEEERAQALVIRALAGAQPDTASVVAALSTLSPAGTRALREMLPTLAASVPRAWDMAIAAEWLGVPAGDETPANNWVHYGQTQAARRDWMGAVEATRQLPPALASRAVELRALYAGLPFASVPDEVARVSLRELRALPLGGPRGARFRRGDTEGLFVPRRLLLDAMLSMRLGDTIRAEQIAVELDAHAPTELVAVFASEYAALIRARVLMGRGDAAGALALLGPPRLEAHLAFPDFGGWPKALERQTRIEALRAMGRDAEAELWGDGFPDNTGYDVVWAAFPRQLT